MVNSTGAVGSGVTRGGLNVATRLQSMLVTTSTLMIQIKGLFL
jgi:hypothetical protein